METKSLPEVHKKNIKTTPDTVFHVTPDSILTELKVTGPF